MFDSKYEKFRKTVRDFDLIPENYNTVVVAASGGKDAGVLAALFLEYKKRERPDLKLELATVPVPDWVYNPTNWHTKLSDDRSIRLLNKQQSDISAWVTHWTSQGFTHETIPLPSGFDSRRIHELKVPCLFCFVIKMRAFLKLFCTSRYESDTLFAFGLLKWDAMYAAITQLLKSDGSLWQELKANAPQKYEDLRLSLAAFSPYPKLDRGIPGKTIYRIQPLLEFDDTETAELANLLRLPLVPDICHDIYGDKFNQDRRSLSAALNLFTRVQKDLGTPRSALLFDYRSFVAFMQKVGVLPPPGELDGAFYNMCNPAFSEPPAHLFS
jgi:hypothetical protein